MIEKYSTGKDANSEQQGIVKSFIKFLRVPKQFSAVQTLLKVYFAKQTLVLHDIFTRKSDSRAANEQERRRKTTLIDEVYSIEEELYDDENWIAPLLATSRFTGYSGRSIIDDIDDEPLDGDDSLRDDGPLYDTENC